MYNVKQVLKGCVITVLVYVVFVVCFYFVGGEQVQYTEKSSRMTNGTGIIGDVLDETLINQQYKVDMDYLSDIEFLFGTYGRKNKGEIIVRVWNENKTKKLCEKKVEKTQLKNDSNFIVHFDKAVSHYNGKLINIEIVSPKTVIENAITVYAGERTKATNVFSIDGREQPGELCFRVIGYSDYFFGNNFWIFALVCLLAILLYAFRMVVNVRDNHPTGIVAFANVYAKYKFLIKQLVLRDFKVKYKRSVLGFMWSFLNPLLTMLVQYVIFSTIFRNNIDNYPVYLLTGSVIFGFFSEAVGAGLGAIVVNASLITKVYVPKSIYPLTKVLATAINLLISMIPLLLTVIITGERITLAFLFLPFSLVCVIVFCIGMSFLLSASMVFFRDTQFLWGIITLIWMYATPLFYPESIIPERFGLILTLNPMYHYIKFARTILLDGVSPSAFQYLTCLGSALIFLGIGYWVFKKTEKKFTLYI